LLFSSSPPPPLLLVVHRLKPFCFPLRARLPRHRFARANETVRPRCFPSNRFRWWCVPLFEAARVHRLGNNKWDQLLLFLPNEDGRGHCWGFRLAGLLPVNTLLSLRFVGRFIPSWPVARAWRRIVKQCMCKLFHYEYKDRNSIERSFSWSTGQTMSNWSILWTELSKPKLIFFDCLFVELTSISISSLKLLQR